MWDRVLPAVGRQLLRKRDGAAATCVAQFSINQPSNNILCQGEQYTVTDLSVSGNGAEEVIDKVTYTFTNSNGLNAIALNGATFSTGVVIFQSGALQASLENLEFLSSGTWTITMTVEASQFPQGCMSTFTRTVNVREVPALLGFSVADPSICAGDPVSLNLRADQPSDNYRLGVSIRGTSFGQDFIFTGAATTAVNLTAVDPDGLIFDATRLVNTTTGCASDIVATSTEPLTASDGPAFGLAEADCAPDNLSYTVATRVTTEGNVAYFINGRSFAGGDRFTSEPIALSRSFSFTATDVNGCSSTISGEPPVCDCETRLGTWPESVSICQQDRVQVSLPAGYSPDNNEGVQYQLIRQEGSVRTVINQSAAMEPRGVDFDPIGNDYRPSAVYRLIITSGNQVGSALDASDRCTLRDSLEVAVLATPRVRFATASQVQVCSGEVFAVAGDIDLPAGATSAQLTYNIQPIDENGQLENPFQQLVTVSQSGEFTAYETSFLQSAIISLMEIETSFGFFTTCQVDVEETITARVNVGGGPVINDLVTVCESNAAFYRVRFRPTSSSGGRPTVTGRPGGYDGDVWVSELIPVADDYDIIVTDASACSTPVPNLTVSCECETNLGATNWNGGQLAFCRTADIIFDERPDGFNPAPSDVIVFNLVAIAGDGERIPVASTGVLQPEALGRFGSIESYNAYNPEFVYQVEVFLGSPSDGGPAMNDASCTRMSTLLIDITDAPTPGLQILDPSTNLYSNSPTLSFARGTRDVQFRVAGGINQANRYFWDIDNSGGTYFGNPFSNASYLSLDLDNEPGSYSVTVIEKQGVDTTCSGRATVTYTINEALAGEAQSVYLVTADGENILIVDGDDDCAYQWGFTRRNDPQRTQPEIITGAVFKAYELDGFVPDERIYWVDVTCGEGTTRQFYNRQPNQVNPPRPLMRPVSTERVPDDPGSLLIIPNPVSGSFVVRLEDVPAGAYDLLLHDALGRQVDRRAVRAPGMAPSQLTWHLPPGLTGGMYFLRAATPGHTAITRRLIVNR